uniref:hypothetical protein n=1 Tax=Ndongobacter massiliensis TaxID=1871025 RepID=UPI00093066E7|nr:hypothetical protein [Ndongobacter massiliensis]
MMRELFITNICHECVDLLNRPDFSEKYGDCEIVNITENIPNLRRFLAYRDALDGYKPVIAGGFVGVPSIVTDGKTVTLFD